MLVQQNGTIYTMVWPMLRWLLGGLVSWYVYKTIEDYVHHDGSILKDGSDQASVALGHLKFLRRQTKHICLVVHIGVPG